MIKNALKIGRSNLLIAKPLLHAPSIKECVLKAILDRTQDLPKAEISLFPLRTK